MSEEIKEIFEKLGYKQIKLTDEDICVWYEKPMFQNGKQCIYFYPQKEIRITYEERGKVYLPIINLDLLNAINKQVIELWGKDIL